MAKLRPAQRIALLHYSPIQATVEGEPPEIYAFLGCSRLEEPLNRYAVTVPFHGHAHHGKPESRTLAGVLVYTVSRAHLQAVFPDRPAFHFLELPVPRASAAHRPDRAVLAASVCERGRNAIHRSSPPALADARG